MTPLELKFRSLFLSTLTDEIFNYLGKNLLCYYLRSF